MCCFDLVSGVGRRAPWHGLLDGHVLATDFDPAVVDGVTALLFERHAETRDQLQPH
jgi:hypothetical protein